MNHSRKSVLWFVIATILIMFDIAVTFWSYRQIDEAAALRMHTAVVLSDANSLMAELVDAETGQRGFLLTGDEAYLQPYLKVREGLEARLQALRKLTTVEAAQKHLDKVIPMVAAKMEELKIVVALNRKHDMAGALAIIGSGDIALKIIDQLKFNPEYGYGIECLRPGVQLGMALREGRARAQARALLERRRVPPAGAGGERVR